MEFSTKLRNLRIQRGLTQMELAERIGTSQSSITSWEQARREPDFRTIAKIADYFGVPMTALLPSSDDLDDSYYLTTVNKYQSSHIKDLYDLVNSFSTPILLPSQNAGSVEK